MRVIAIDPGTRCGWAYTDAYRVEPDQSGVWDLSPPKGRRGARCMWLADRLDELIGERSGHEVAVYYEDVKGQKSLYAAQCYGSLVGAIESTCERRGVAYDSFHTSAVKIRATGKGNADKAAMVAAFADEYGREFPLKENDRVDALYILALGLEDLM